MKWSDSITRLRDLVLLQEREATREFIRELRSGKLDPEQTFQIQTLLPTLWRELEENAPGERQFPGTQWTPITDASNVQDVATSMGNIYYKDSAGHAYRRVAGAWQIFATSVVSLDANANTGQPTYSNGGRSEVITYDADGNAVALPLIPEQTHIFDISGPGSDGRIWATTGYGGAEVLWMWDGGAWTKLPGPAAARVSAGSFNPCFSLDDNDQHGVARWDQGNYTNLAIPRPSLDVGHGRTGYLWATNVSYAIYYFLGVGNWHGVLGIDGFRIAADENGMPVVCDEHGWMYQRS